ncbi:SsgA family sporulation/cell division regulator [Actinomadura keratinilytica]
MGTSSPTATTTSPSRSCCGTTPTRPVAGSAPSSSTSPARSASPDRKVPRALLEAGLRTTCTEGAVRVWPCGRVQTVVEFHAPGEEPLVIQFDAVVLIRFLRRTHAEGPAGEPAVAAAAHEPGPSAATSATTGTTPTGAPG